MSQMKMIDKEELAMLRCKADCCDAYMEEINKIEKECYPDVPYWIDVGNTHMVNLAILDQVRYDLKKYRKWKIRKQKRLERRKK